MRLTRALRLALLSVVLGIIVWCGTTSAPIIAEHATRLDPPAYYRTWWQDAMRCTSRARKFEDVEFYVVDGNSFTILALDGKLVDVIGFYDVLQDRIYVAQDYKDDAAVVTHEMVHALGVVGHPVQYFDRCGL